MKRSAGSSSIISRSASMLSVPMMKDGGDGGSVMTGKRSQGPVGGSVYRPTLKPIASSISMDSMDNDDEDLFSERGRGQNATLLQVQQMINQERRDSLSVSASRGMSHFQPSRMCIDRNLDERSLLTHVKP